MQSIRISSRPYSRISKWNQLTVAPVQMNIYQSNTYRNLFTFSKKWNIGVLTNLLMEQVAKLKTIWNLPPVLQKYKILNILRAEHNFLNLCLRWRNLRSYCFVVEVTFKQFAIKSSFPRSDNVWCVESKTLTLLVAKLAWYFSYRIRVM